MSRMDHGEHTETPWAQGRTLMTPQTQRWSAEELAKNDEVERRMVFAYFTAEDQGRGRKRVAICENPEDAAFIVRACNAYHGTWFSKFKDGWLEAITWVGSLFRQ